MAAIQKYYSSVKENIFFFSLKFIVHIIGIIVNFFARVPVCVAGYSSLRQLVSGACDASMWQDYVNPIPVTVIEARTLIGCADLHLTYVKTHCFPFANVKQYVKLMDM